MNMRADWPICWQCCHESLWRFKLGSGPVTEDDELGRPVAVPGKFYISVGVPEIIGKFHEVAPYVAINDLFSLKNQKEYGISNFTVSFGKFGEGE